MLDFDVKVDDSAVMFVTENQREGTPIQTHGRGDTLTGLLSTPELESSEGSLAMKKSSFKRNSTKLDKRRKSSIWETKQTLRKHKTGI